MEYNISYKEESIPVPLSGFIVRLVLLTRLALGLLLVWTITELREGWGVWTTTDMF